MTVGLRPRLFIAASLILLVTTGITFWLLAIAESQLREQAFDQLASVRAEKARQVEAEMERWLDDLNTDGAVYVDTADGVFAELPGGQMVRFPASERINDIMTSERRWSEIGLGESGETYIVDADTTIRNDSRFLIEDADGFYAALDAAGIPYDDIAEQNTTIGLLPVDTEGTRDALDGNEGQAIFNDYREISVLSDYGPLDLPAGLDWVIMSEIDEAEAFDTANDMRRLSLYVIGITGTVLFAAIWFGARTLVKPVEQMKAQKIAIESELNVAAGIQRSLLPLVFPLPPEHMEFRLHASLVPANEVGGDFYDWGSIDADRHWFVVGDVSGKGVPAALFMAASKTLIRSGAMSGEPLDQMLTRVNAEIQESNTEFMFATVWAGVLDVHTGEVEYVNAGHNPPLLIGDSGREFLTESHGPFVGPVPGVTYHKGQFTMKPGDRLIVYSDGVTEAMDPAGALYGEERLAELPLPTEAEDASVAIVDAVLVWEQGTRSDDVTVAVLDFVRTRQVRAASIQVYETDPTYAVTQTNTRVDEFAAEHGLAADAAAKVQMALDEILVNVLTYGQATLVNVDLNWRPGWLNITISDNGAPFDPLSAPVPDTTLSLHEREVGGLGLHLVRNLMDDVTYTYREGRNVLRLTLEATG